MKNIAFCNLFDVSKKIIFTPRLQFSTTAILTVCHLVVFFPDWQSHPIGDIGHWCFISAVLNCRRRQIITCLKQYCCVGCVNFWSSVCQSYWSLRPWPMLLISYVAEQVNQFELGVHVWQSNTIC